VLAGFEIWAISVRYALRVTSDVPTFIALVRSMSAHPFATQTPFVAGSHLETPHATPYMQTLAFLWRLFRPANAADTVTSAGLMFGVVGLFVTAFTLGAVYLYARHLAGRRAGFLSVLALLVLFGPAHVVWASDLTFHGLLYSAFYPQNVAFGLMLLTLLTLERRGWRWLLVTIVLAAATMLVHPFTGVLLCGLATVRAALAARTDPGQQLRTPAVLIAAFAIGSLWPAYSLNRAFAETGVHGVLLIALCTVAPTLVRRLPLRLPRVISASVDKLASGRSELRLANVGFELALLLAAWEVLLIVTPSHDPLIRSNHLAIYWGDGRARWALMLGIGAVGVAGLARLARRGHWVPAVWFAGCYAIGLAGAAGAPLPVWYRFFLLCQIPLAIGAGVVAANVSLPPVRPALVATFAAVLAVKLFTLLALPQTITYFGSPLQDGYYLGRLIPSQPGTVATDPFTSYYVPAATGHRVLTVTKAHVTSPGELATSARAYVLIHRLFSSTAPADWLGAFRQMAAQGVRYVAVDFTTSLSAPTLERFSYGPTPLVRSDVDARSQLNEYLRLNALATYLRSDAEFSVYRIDPARLAGAAADVTAAALKPVRAAPWAGVADSGPWRVEAHDAWLSGYRYVLIQKARFLPPSVAQALPRDGGVLLYRTGLPGRPPTAYYRLNQMGSVVRDESDFVIYRLHPNTRTRHLLVPP
jgi:hypothetical protein